MSLTVIVSNLHPRYWLNAGFRAAACLCFALSAVDMALNGYLPLFSLGLLCWCASSFFARRPRGEGSSSS